MPLQLQPFAHSAPPRSAPSTASPRSCRMISASSDSSVKPVRRQHPANSRSPNARSGATAAARNPPGPSCFSTEKANRPPAARPVGNDRDDAVERADIHEDVGGGDEVGPARRQRQRLQVGLEQPVVDALGLGLPQHCRRDVAAFEKCSPTAAAARPSARCRSRDRRAWPKRVRPVLRDRLGQQFRHAVVELLDQRLVEVLRILVEQRLDEGARRGVPKQAARPISSSFRPAPARSSGSSFCAMRQASAAWSSAPAASCISPMRNQPIAQPGASSSAPSISSAAAA